MNDYQSLLFPYAYNLLGSSEDARDAIQDVMTSYMGVNKNDIRDEKSYLIKSVINQSILLKNKRKKTAPSPDPWLPEPVSTEEADTNILLQETASFSILVLLERLNARERAVFILKEGFDYSHEEIAGILSASVENSRKILSRARVKLGQYSKPAFPAKNDRDSLQHIGDFIDAIRSRDTQRLEGLLLQDVHFTADGGASVTVVKKTSHGAREVADLLLYVHQRYNTELSIIPTLVNYQPALLYYDGDILRSCQVFTMKDGRIKEINTVLDPAKLKNIATSKNLQVAV